MGKSDINLDHKIKAALGGLCARMAGSTMLRGTEDGFTWIWFSWGLVLIPALSGQVAPPVANVCLPDAHRFEGSPQPSL